MVGISLGWYDLFILEKIIKYGFYVERMNE
jgi:hypothetical protein